MDKKEYYDNKYFQQDRVLKHLFELGVFNHFYLSGGTALHRFILNDKYRYSDDLDLFSINIDPKETRTLNIISNEIINKVSDTKVLIESQYMKRYALLGIKTDIIKDFVPRSGPLSTIYEKGYEILVDSVENILVNKLLATFSRDEGRDFFDLYVILKEYDFSFADFVEGFRNKTTDDVELVIDRIVNLNIDSRIISDINAVNDQILNDFVKNYKCVVSDFFGMKKFKEYTMKSTQKTNELGLK